MVRLTHGFYTLEKKLEAINFGCGTSSVEEGISGMVPMTLGFLCTINLCPSSSGQLAIRLHIYLYQSVSDVATEKTTLNSHILQLVKYAG